MENLSKWIMVAGPIMELLIFHSSKAGCKDAGA
jgi:hypothetical protein